MVFTGLVSGAGTEILPSLEGKYKKAGNFGASVIYGHSDFSGQDYGGSLFKSSPDKYISIMLEDDNKDQCLGLLSPTAGDTRSFSGRLKCFGRQEILLECKLDEDRSAQQSLRGFCSGSGFVSEQGKKFTLRFGEERTSAFHKIRQEAGKK
jgi:hypothetical protein